ncbi:TPR-like protein [Ephemerocybe angulata]|uniref:TPR-like protein n=1 Tax=Ephemerocybe angulata TaxID=980116 RepID=A0A8H6I1B2_9AGAR|nr:TPR-like protein [Tulosesus angulatus]
MACLRGSNILIAVAEEEDSHEQLFEDGVALTEQYQATRADLDDLATAISKLRRAVELMPKDHSDMARRLSWLGHSLRLRFGSTGDVQAIAEAISAEQRALELTPEGHPDMTRGLANLGVSLCSRFQHIGDIQDLAEAISALQRALEVTPEGHPEMALRLANLGASLGSRFERTGHLQDIAEAISMKRRAVDLTREGHPDMASRLANLGSSLQFSFKRTGDLQDLAEAISAAQGALDLTPEDHPDMALRLAGLGNSLLARFQRTGDLQDLAEAISAQQRALDLTPEGHPDMALRLANLGSSLHSRFQRTGDLQDLAEAISAQQRALDLTPEGHPDMALQLPNLGNSLLARFQRTGDLQDIAEAISAQQRALDLTPEGHPDTALRLASLGHSLWSRFNRTGDLQDIAEAISANQRALQLTPEGHLDMALRLANLGASLGSRFERTGDLQVIAEAMSALQRALDLTPEGHPDMALRLANLGSSLHSRFKRTGDLQDLADAISAQQRALDLTPEGHPDMALQLANLGNSLLARFQRTGDLQDIAEAISAQQRALDLTPEGHPNMALRLANLGSSLHSRFKRTGDLQDLADAISAKQRALDLTPEGHPDMALRLANLGHSLGSRFERTRDLQVIAEAISRERLALKLLPEGHPTIAVQLANLGASLLSRFKLTGDLQDLPEAISMEQRALEITPEGHPDMALRLYNLAYSFKTRFGSTGDIYDLTEAVSKYRTSAHYPFGHPDIRLQAAKNWAELLEKHNPVSPDILTAFDTVIRLITLMTTLDQVLENRYSRLVNTSGLALQAASAAFALERVDKALEWLEQGRCLVWRQLTSLRTPLDDLRRHDGHLADRFLELSRKLEGAGSVRIAAWSGMSTSEKVSLEDQARVHVRSAREWDDLVVKVRATPGFERFLEPSPWYSLLPYLPEAGHAIIVNVDARRCDAIVLSAGRSTPHHIPLPSFSLVKCNQYRKDLTNHLQVHDCRERGSTVAMAPERGDEFRGVRKLNHATVQDILRGLWKDLVKPIIQELGIANIPAASTEAAPRIWWCPTGPLSFLPIHAAGIYTSAGTECLLDYAVSSYTPTIAALTDRISSARPIQKAVSGLFMTCQPNAPGRSHIPETTTEVQSIYDLARMEGMRAQRFDGSAITSATCLDSMERFSIIHLACHAYQDATNPLESRFLFHNGSLDLLSILQRNLKHADLAFLSACQTGTGSEKLPDEAVHLAAGMLAAGYRRVVATMWAIRDQHAPAVATDFYQYLLDHRDPADGSGFYGTHSARALHHATQQLRIRLGNDSDESLLAWIPYVHFGH